MSEPAILFEGVAKYFGPVIGVEDVSLRVEPGEVFGFLGANGAGKTTTIRLLLDLLRPSRGRAAVLGFDCQRESLAARRQIGYLPGELPVYSDMTAGRYLDHLARLDGRRVAPEYLAELLRRFDVSAVDLERRLREQSHGMKQKIGIVQALMTRPPVVVLDEPTAGLDPFMVHAFRAAIDELRSAGDTTVFLSSHVLTEVETTCDRIAVIRGGRIIRVARIDDLRRTAPRRVVVDFSRAVAAPHGDRLTVLSAAPRRWEVEIHGSVAPFLQSLANLPVHDVHVEAFSLERQLLCMYGAPADDSSGRACA